jgi:tRNA (guanine37-N1)-methyltransferase
LKLDVFSLFPEAFDWLRTQRSVQNALREGNELNLFNYRDTTPLSAGQVDDSPYGGGAGMVLRVDVIDAALKAAYGEGPLPRIVLLTPTGRLLDDELADELVAEPHVALLCGRYEGFDERVHEHFADDEVSIGRYVLAGGELPAMVVADVVMRKLPGALGHADSAAEESYSRLLEGMPEYPHYTRPPVHRGWGVPEILLSGDHGKVREWRLERSRERAAAFAEAEREAAAPSAETSDESAADAE